MSRTKRVFLGQIGALILLVGLLLPASLLAHAGLGVQHLNNVPAGPYRVYVWSDPEPPRVGEYHVIIALTENIAGDTTGLAGGPILDAYVTVEITHRESGAMHSARATHDDARNKLFYGASFAPARQGVWSVQVRIAQPGCVNAEEEEGRKNDSSVLPCAPEQVVGFEDEILPKPFSLQPVWGGLLSVILILGAGLLYGKTQPAAASVAAVGAGREAEAAGRPNPAAPGRR